MSQRLFRLVSFLVILAMLISTGAVQASTPVQPAGKAAVAPADTAEATYSISGRVTDGSGNPLQGVTIAAFPTSTSGKVTILDVSADYDLAGYYPIGLGAVANKITVTIDWGGKIPGKVRYQFGNTSPIDDTVTSNQTSKTFRFDQVLQPGVNLFRITAIAADGTASNPRIYQLTGWTSELGWMNQILGSLPYIGPDKIEIKVYVPGDPINMINNLDVWLPGKPTHLGPQAVGKLTIPLRGGRYEAGLGARFERDKSTPGIKPWYAKSALLGKNDLGFDFTGQFEGNLTNTFPYLDRPDLIKFEASGKITFEISESAIVVIQPLAPVGPAIIGGLKAVPPVYDWIKDRAKFYIKLTPEVGGEMTLNWGVQDLEPVSANLYFQIDLEGGLKIDLYVAEGKVYVGGGSKLDFMFVPEPGIDKWVFYGKAGYELKSGWFTASHEEKIEWVAYERGGMAAQQMVDDFRKGNLDWTLIPRSYTGPSYSTFQPVAQARQPFAAASLKASQGTLSAPLVTNVFPYIEPSLAMRADDQALLLWNYDDPGRPLGQGYDLQFSRWSGGAWSTPTVVTSDTYPDSTPQVAWLPNGNALAVWERLDDPALPITATLDITQTGKFDLAWAVYDSSANTWSPPQWLTHTLGECDQTPILSRGEDGSLWVAWRNNPHGQQSGDAQFPDRILTARWNGSGWDTPQVAVTAIPGLSDLSLAHDGSLGALTWTAEIAPTGMATPTLQLFSSQYNGTSWSTPQQLTDDALQHTHPRLVYHSGQLFLVWLAGDTLTLQTMSNLQDKRFSLTALTTGQSVALPGGLQVDQFNLLQGAAGNFYVVCTAQQSQQRDLYLAYYDASLGLWGQPMPITADAPSQSYPAAALDSSQQVLVAFGQTEILTQTETTTLPESTQVVTYTLPVDGETDLYTLRHSLSRDLAIESIAISNDHPASGTGITITVALANRGDLPLQNVRLAFADEGMDFDIRSVPQITAGQSITLTASFTPPSTGGTRTISITADPLNTIDELDETNNTQSLEAFGPDLEIGRLLLDQQGSQVELQVEVQNLGPAASPATTLDLFEAANTSTPLMSEILPPLNAGQEITVTLTGNLQSLSAGTHHVTAVANPGLDDFGELDAVNNEYPFDLQLGTDLKIDPDQLLNTPFSSSPLVFSAVVQNIGSQDSITTTLAVFSTPDLQNAIFTTDVPALAAGESITLTAVLDAPLACGLFFQVDPGQTMSEVSRANNLAAASGADGLCNSIFLPMMIRTGEMLAHSMPENEPGDLSGAANYMAVTGADGTYTLSNLPAGSYIIAPAQSNHIFTPAARSVTLPPNSNNQNFQASGGTIVPGEMVYVPAGNFLRGCVAGNNGGYSCYSDELPSATIYLDAFYIDKTEVTNEQYAACVAAGSCTAPSSSASYTRNPYYGDPTYANYPVIWVNWNQATAYCAWAGKRLPTEAEWEKAARGTDGRAFSWGSVAPTCSLANYGGICGCVGDTSAVGSYPAGASPYGALDMAGNVYEWVSDWHSESYYAVSPSSNPTGPATGTARVLHGGGWDSMGHYIRAAYRYSHLPLTDSSDNTGFRCAAPE